MQDRTPQGVIAAATRKLRPYEEAPNVGDWLVCPSGHVLAQYVHKERTMTNDWGKLSGAVINHQFGRRIISCGICGKVAQASQQAFACQVVSNEAVQKAVRLVG